MINCIVAVDKNQGIGFQGRMPWPHLSDDMKWFRNLTTSNAIIMGRKTWESIGSKNLPGRINIVISRNIIPNCHYSVSSTKEALEYCKIKFPTKDIFIIGGSTIYEQYLNYVDRFYVTEINETYKCDKFFPYDWVKKQCKNIVEHGTYTSPINFTIKEYNYDTPRT